MKRLLSLRVTQTALFVAVVAVAVAVLATWIFGALSSEVAGSVRTQQLKDASAMADSVGGYLPVSPATRGGLHDHVSQLGAIFGDDVRVFDTAGVLVESRQSLAIPASLIESLLARDVSASEPYASVDLRPGGLAVAAVPIPSATGGRAGIVIVSNGADQARQTLVTARDQLVVVTLVVLLLAALISFLFSDFIARQARGLVRAADDIAAGDFTRRLPRGPFPGEIRDLVEAFNRMAEQLGDAFETLRGQERAQREFVANASHELRTPIAALKGAIEILETGGKEKPAVRDEFLATMGEEANRLQRLVDNLFTLAQVDSGRLHLHLEPERAEGIVRTVTTVMVPLANAAGVTLRADPGAGDAYVLADRDRITQVLLGFVDNAVKHSRPGDVVSVSLEPAGDDAVRLAVSDTGSGIAPDVLPHVFDRFFTQRKSAEGHRRGSGLGLAIAEQIVEAHGSRIEVESEVGRGTTFRFDLPRASA